MIPEKYIYNTGYPPYRLDETSFQYPTRKK